MFADIVFIFLFILFVWWTIASGVAITVIFLTSSSKSLIGENWRPFGVFWLIPVWEASRPYRYQIHFLIHFLHKFCQSIFFVKNDSKQIIGVLYIFVSVLFIFLSIWYICKCIIIINWELIDEATIWKIIHNKQTIEKQYLDYIFFTIKNDKVIVFHRFWSIKGYIYNYMSNELLK